MTDSQEKIKTLQLQHIGYSLDVNSDKLAELTTDIAIKFAEWQHSIDPYNIPEKLMEIELTFEILFDYFILNVYKK